MSPATNLEKVIFLFKPSADGKSDWKSIAEIQAAGLSWSTNGNIRRGVAFNVTQYIWETRRIGGVRSTVTHLRTSGIQKAPVVNSIISNAIKNAFITNKICNFSLLPVAKIDLEIDHRFGFKDHPKYEYINDQSKQTVCDFQQIHRSLNQKKRQMCLDCQSTKIRPRHPEKDFVEGNEKLDDVTVCNGCYLAQPERYRQ
jgi:hypothetical protein